MFIYSTCRDCGGLLHVTDNDTVHPLCTPQPTKIERLAQDWLAATLAGDEFTADGIEYDIDQYDTRPPRLLDAALRYAEWGWPVFPLKPLSIAIKDPQPEKAAKRPSTPHGFKDATTDPDRIRAWWQRHPDSSIGLPTGLTFDVIDIDTPKGPASYAQLIADDVIPDIHGQVATASGGLHLYILPTGDGNSTEIMPNVDYRGVGGYVVAPPSMLWRRSRSYSWITQPSPVILGSKVGA